MSSQVRDREAEDFYWTSLQIIVLFGQSLTLNGQEGQALTVSLAAAAAAIMVEGLAPA